MVTPSTIDGISYGWASCVFYSSIHWRWPLSHSGTAAAARLLVVHRPRTTTNQPPRERVQLLSFCSPSILDVMFVRWGRTAHAHSKGEIDRAGSLRSGSGTEESIKSRSKNLQYSAVPHVLQMHRPSSVVMAIPSPQDLTVGRENSASRGETCNFLYTRIKIPHCGKTRTHRCPNLHTRAHT